MTVGRYQRSADTDYQQIGR